MQTVTIPADVYTALVLAAKNATLDLAEIGKAAGVAPKDQPKVVALFDAIKRAENSKR